MTREPCSHPLAKPVLSLFNPRLPIPLPPHPAFPLSDLESPSSPYSRLLPPARPTHPHILFGLPHHHLPLSPSSPTIPTPLYNHPLHFTSPARHLPTTGFTQHPLHSTKGLHLTGSESVASACTPATASLVSPPRHVSTNHSLSLKHSGSPSF